MAENSSLGGVEDDDDDDDADQIYHLPNHLSTLQGDLCDRKLAAETETAAALTLANSSGSSPTTASGATTSGATSVTGTAPATTSGHLCRLLDCDTISQAKGKILDTLYRSVGHSQRPAVEDVTLYWRCLKAKSTPTTSSTDNPQPPSTASTGTANTGSHSNSSSREVVVEHHPHIGGGGGGGVPSTNVVTTTNSQHHNYTIQDIYGVASMMSKADADKIYNASRRSDASLLMGGGGGGCLEVAQLPLADYDASTQMLTANEATWRRLNTLSHYAVPDGAQLVLSLREGVSTENPQSLPKPCELNSTRINLRGLQNNQLPLPPPAPAPGSGPFGHHHHRQQPHQGRQYGGDEDEHLHARDDGDDDDDGDDRVSELNSFDHNSYHLYESIPAMYSTAGKGNTTTTTLSRVELYGTGSGSNHHLESLYNLSSNGSSTLTRQQQQQMRVNNGGHLLSNYYHLGSGTGSRAHNYIQSTLTPVTYDVIGGGGGNSRRQCQPVGSAILGPEEMISYGRHGSNLNLGTSGPIRYGHPISPTAIYSPTSLMTSPGLNTSGRALLAAVSSRAHLGPSKTQPYSLGRGTHNGFLTSALRGEGGIRRQIGGTRGSRSLARSFYDRLSSLVRPGSSLRSTRQGTASTGFKYGGASLTFGGRKRNNYLGNYEHEGDDEGDNVEDDDEDEDEDELSNSHNIWHLVKPSSLIADCIIGATGSFLYEEEASGTAYSGRLLATSGKLGKRGGGGKFGGADARNAAQRAALRRRRRKDAFFSGNFRNGRTGNGTLNSRLNAKSLTSAASAALSASQMNLHSCILNGSSSNSAGLLSVSPVVMATPTTTTTSSSPSSSSTSPLLSLFTSSASHFFATLLGKSTSDRTSTDTFSSAAGHPCKSIPEIYLTRLLSTKGTIQQYVDDLLATIFTVNERLPIAIKWLFDFLDAASLAQQSAATSAGSHHHHLLQGLAGGNSQAGQTQVWSDDLGRQWKSNSLVGRFWADLLRSPELLFDLGSTGSALDVCLKVLAANLAEAAGCAGCEVSSTGSNKHRGHLPSALYKGTLSGGGGGVQGVHGSSSSGSGSESSQTSKLLFGRDIAAYRALIGQYYADIALLPPISEGDILAYMKDVSKVRKKTLLTFFVLLFNIFLN